jgi:hypothetical protein
VRAHGHDGAVAARAHLHATGAVARVRRGQQVLAPVLDPAHGAAEPPGQIGDRDVLGVEVHLRAEAAAHGGAEHAQPRLRHRERRRQPRAQHVRGLGRGPHRQRPVLPIERRHHAPPFHGRGAAAGLAERLGEADLGAGQRRVDAALLVAGVHEDVVGQAVVHARGIGSHRRLGVDGRGQRRVRHPDDVERILRAVAVARHDGRHGLAHEARLAHRERGPARLLVVAPGQLGPDRPRGRGEVGARHHRLDPRKRERLARVDFHDPRVGMGAPQKRDGEQSRQREVTHEAGASEQQRGVLPSSDARADVPRRHGFGSGSSAGFAGPTASEEAVEAPSERSRAARIKASR